MKKKIKIFSTIASLCLAVALMAFGVYAAKNVSYNVTSTITFDAADVFVTINAKAYKDADGNITGATEITSAAATEYKSYTGTDPMVPKDAGKDDTTETWTPAIELDSVNKYVVLVINIVNDGESEVTVKTADKTGADTYTNGNMTFVSLTGNDATGVKIAPTANADITYVAYVTDTAASIDEFVVNFELDITRSPKS